MLKTWQVIEQKRQKLANVDWHENDHSKWMSYKVEGKLSEQKVCDQEKQTYSCCRQSRVN